MAETKDVRLAEYSDTTWNGISGKFVRKYVCEIYENGRVIDYLVDPESKESLNAEEYRQDKEKVLKFFSDLVSLVNNADRTEERIDNCTKAFKLHLADGSSKVISAYTYAGDRSVLDIYKEFIGETDDYPYSPKSTIEIVRQSITGFTTDAIVNAANEGLAEGGGVCGYIFEAAGSRELTKACQAIGHCDTGNAVITPAYRLGSKYIIHAVGPVYRGGNSGEADKLYGAYFSSLKLAKENGCRSIAFPLISAGIFGYPLNEAWDIALKASDDFIRENSKYNISIYFAVLNERILELGRKKLEAYGEK